MLQIQESEGESLARARWGAAIKHVRMLVRMDRLHHVFRERQEIARVKSLHAMMFVCIQIASRVALTACPRPESDKDLFAEAWQPLLERDPALWDEAEVNSLVSQGSVASQSWLPADLTKVFLILHEPNFGITLHEDGRKKIKRKTTVRSAPCRPSISMQSRSTSVSQAAVHPLLNLYLTARTFPDNDYFKAQGEGQVALFNLLKAYSNFDFELGYCQGMAFVAGLLLLQVTKPSCLIDSLTVQT